MMKQLAGRHRRGTPGGSCYLAAWRHGYKFSPPGAAIARTAANIRKAIFPVAFHQSLQCRTELQPRQDRYERAIDWLKAVQKGDVSPDLPKIVEDGVEKTE